MSAQPIPKNHFRRRLASGAILVGECLPEFKSAAIGIWVKAGSRDERLHQEGAAHFVEHMVFKGTENRSAREIALSLERVGGYLEAFTTKESTCFYARVLSEDQAVAAGILADLVSNPLLSQGDLERERSVILEEHYQVEDTPEEMVGELAMGRLWRSHVMGSSILGSAASIQAMSLEGVRSYHQRHYAGPQLVIGAVGNVDATVLQECFDQQLSLPLPVSRGSRITPDPAPPEITWVEKESAQLYLSLATTAPPRDTADSYAAQLLIEILGGGMSSRLFQKIREEAGLAYSVNGYSEHFSDTGILGITLGVSPENTSQALTRVREEMDSMADSGPTGEELAAAKAAARGSLLMGRESLSQRMLSLAGMEAEGRWYQSVEDLVSKYEGVTLGSIHRMAAKLLNPSRHQLVVVGPAEARNLEVFKGRAIQILESAGPND